MKGVLLVLALCAVGCGGPLKRDERSAFSPKGIQARWVELDYDGLSDDAFEVSVLSDGKEFKVTTIDGAAYNEDLGPKMVWKGDKRLELHITAGRVRVGPVWYPGPTPIEVLIVRKPPISRGRR